MSGQSKYIYHIVDDEELEHFLDYSDVDIDDRNKIEDLDKFIRELKQQNLYSKELAEFIDRYCQFSND